jgi:hypothetical protein
MERNSLTKKFKDKETRLFKMDHHDLFVIAFLDKIFETFLPCNKQKVAWTLKRGQKGSTLTKQRSAWLREECSCGPSIEICIAPNTCWTKLNLLRVCLRLTCAISQLQSKWLMYCNICNSWIT